MSNEQVAMSNERKQSKLDELIQQYCPDGIEFVPLWSVTIWDKKFNSVDKKKQPKVISYPYILAKDMFALEQENGDVFLLSTGEQTGWTTEDIAGDFLCEGEVVSIPWGKSRKVSEVMKYYNGKFVTADNRIATSSDTSILSNKYLYYWMLSQGDLIDSFYRGSGLKHPSMKDVLDMKMPLPPLEVQSEIVRILDNFTELTAELTARKKQYEYYRDTLLKSSIEIKNVKLGSVCEVYDGTHQTPKYTNSGVPFVSVENIDDLYGTTKYISAEDFSKYRIKPRIGDVFMTRITAGVIGRCTVVDKNDDLAYYVSLALLRPEQSILDSKYLKYYLESGWGRKELAKRILWDATPTKINKDDIGKVYISLPPLEVQQRLVRVLDNFDSICSDLNIGLPAEIEARKKQYEFYRDALLTYAATDKTILTDRQTDRRV